MSERTGWLHKYGHLTIEQLKNINFKGQGQIQTDAVLWNDHLAERGNSIID